MLATRSPPVRGTDAGRSGWKTLGCCCCCCGGGGGGSHSPPNSRAVGFGPILRSANARHSENRPTSAVTSQIRALDPGAERRHRYEDRTRCYSRSTITITIIIIIIITITDAIISGQSPSPGPTCTYRISCRDLGQVSDSYLFYSWSFLRRFSYASVRLERASVRVYAREGAFERGCCCCLPECVLRELNFGLLILITTLT